MAYNEQLAERVRVALSRKRSIREQKMFGGICFLMSGNMLVGVWKDSLMVRLGAEQAAKALQEPDVKPFDIVGRPMRGWVVVKPAGLEEDEQLLHWISRAQNFVRQLPKK
ncbi:MAG: hypothetical protein JWN70_4562 [Planctomycetaceae bacterium]|nr:hypothetical protein [Planctomycetaceae bacterium]